MYLLWVFLCVGFSRRVVRCVLFLPVIISSAWFSVICIFVGSSFSVFVLIMCVCVWNIADIIVLAVEGGRMLQGEG